MSEWLDVRKKKPPLTAKQRQPDQFGVQVLIWPPYKAQGYSDGHVAFYGTRVTDNPSFYIYGRCIDVTHWMPLPSPPSATEKS